MLEKTTIDLGFMPLTDCAPLVVAKELGMDAKWGLEITLHKQNSWATLRDKLHAGVLDAGQMLAPMPLASTLGLGGVQEQRRERSNYPCLKRHYQKRHINRCGWCRPSILAKRK